MEKLYYGMFKRNIRLQDQIKFSILKEYPKINGLKYIALEIYDGKRHGVELIIVRKLCEDERQSNFKQSAIIETAKQFFIVVGKATDAKEADLFISKLLGSHLVRGGDNMKIIVANEKEQEIVKKFVAFLNEYDLIDDYMPDMEGNGYESELTYDEFKALAEWFKKCKIIVN